MCCIQLLKLELFWTDASSSVSCFLAERTGLLAALCTLANIILHLLLVQRSVAFRMGAVGQHGGYNTAAAHRPFGKNDHNL